MIDLLEHYIPDSLSPCFDPDGRFHTDRPGLKKKVDETGVILPFRGNTTVFLLDSSTKVKLAQLQSSLYEAAGEMLAEPLQESTFHMTLHDLVNGVPGTAGLEDSMAAAEREARGLLSQWRNGPDIQMTATWMFNMVNTSIVLGLKPADGESWRRLDEMFCALETVVPVRHAMTPHITLAYFRPQVYDWPIVDRLSHALKPVELDVKLRMQDLVLQNFEDMNHYETIG